MSQNAYSEVGYQFHEYWKLQAGDTFVLKIRGEGPMGPMTSVREGSFRLVDKRFTFPPTKDDGAREYTLVTLEAERMTVLTHNGFELHFKRLAASDEPPRWPHQGTSRRPMRRPRKPR